MVQEASAEASAVIASWRPTSVSAPAADFARALVSVAAPQRAARAKALLWAASKLGAFALGVGLDLDPSVLLREETVERFILARGGSLSDPARRTLRTNLRALAKATSPPSGPGATPLARERTKDPYSAGQIAAYLALADAQPTLSRRRRANALVALGAGAGLKGADLRYVRGHDVVVRSGGVVVEVTGRRPRVVPVLARYHDRLVASARFAGPHFIVSGTEPDRHNVTTPLIASLSGGVDLPRLDLGRLRATWLATVAESLGLATFLAAAGVSCTQRLGDIVASLHVADEPEAVALLGGCAG